MLNKYTLSGCSAPPRDETSAWKRPGPEHPGLSTEYLQNVSSMIWAKSSCPLKEVHEDFICKQAEESIAGMEYSGLGSDNLYAHS